MPWEGQRKKALGPLGNTWCWPSYFSATLCRLKIQQTKWESWERVWIISWTLRAQSVNTLGTQTFSFPISHSSSRPIRQSCLPDITSGNPLSTFPRTIPKNSCSRVGTGHRPLETSKTCVFCFGVCTCSLLAAFVGAHAAAMCPEAGHDNPKWPTECPNRPTQQPNQHEPPSLPRRLSEAANTVVLLGCFHMFAFGCFCWLWWCFYVPSNEPWQPQVAHWMPTPTFRATQQGPIWPQTSRNMSLQANLIDFPRPRRTWSLHDFRVWLLLLVFMMLLYAQRRATEARSLTQKKTIPRATQQGPKWPH
jgi:hypothetical protein